MNKKELLKRIKQAVRVLRGEVDVEELKEERDWYKDDAQCTHRLWNESNNLFMKLCWKFNVNPMAMTDELTETTIDEGLPF